MNAKLNGWLWRIVFLAAGLIFGTGATYGIVTNRLDDVCDKVEDHEKRIRTVEGTVIEANGRLGAIEASQRKTDANLDTMGLDIITIKLDLIEIKNAVK